MPEYDPGSAKRLQTKSDQALAAFGEALGEGTIQLSGPFTHELVESLLALTLVSNETSTPAQRWGSRILGRLIGALVEQRAVPPAVANALVRHYHRPAETDEEEAAP